MVYPENFMDVEEKEEEPTSDGDNESTLLRSTLVHSHSRGITKPPHRNAKKKAARKKKPNSKKKQKKARELRTGPRCTNHDRYRRFTRAYGVMRAARQCNIHVSNLRASSFGDWTRVSTDTSFDPTTSYQIARRLSLTLPAAVACTYEYSTQ